MIDLDHDSLKIVKKIIKQHLPNAEVKAFGSRVKGTAKAFSDLDLVIFSDKKIAIDKMNEIKFAFSDSNLPILVDIIDWNAISAEFQAKIRHECVAL